jgi:hypothetical protein
MMRYYVSRLVVVAVAVALLVLAELPWWIAAVAGVLMLGFFVWAPRGGRYVTRRQPGVTALRRDERTQAVANKASRNGFVALMLTAGAVAIYWGVVAETDVPAFVLYLLVALGWLVYFISDFWLRRG